MKPLGISLILLVPGFACAQKIQFHSPAMEQLIGVEGESQAAADADKSERVSAGGGLGFSVNTLEPAGYVAADGKPLPPDDPARPQIKNGGSDRYVFEGKSPMKGVTIYTPKEDPNGDGSTSGGEGPKPPFSKLMTWGAIGGGGALAAAGIIGLALGGPVGLFAALLGIGAALLGGGIVMALVNRKASGA
jgi:hypothetical protein